MAPNIVFPPVSGGGGGGSGSVDSVAGKTGVVYLNKSDVGLDNVDNTSDINKPVSTATQDELDVVVTAVSDVETTVDNLDTKVTGIETDVATVTSDLATLDTKVTANQNNLDNVDNTSDLDKPISTAVQAALDAMDSDAADIQVGEGLTKDVNDVITLNTATTTTLGGIKVGTGLDVSPDGLVISTVSGSIVVAVADIAARLALPQVPQAYTCIQVDDELTWYLDANDDPSVEASWLRGSSTSGAVNGFKGKGDVTARVGIVEAKEGDYTSNEIVYADGTNGNQYKMVIDDTRPYIEDASDSTRTPIARLAGTNKPTGLRVAYVNANGDLEWSNSITSAELVTLNGMTDNIKDTFDTKVTKAFVANPPAGETRVALLDDSGELTYAVEINLTELATLNNITGNVQTQIDDLQAEIDTNEASVTSAQGEVDTLKDDVTDLKSDVETLQTEVESTPRNAFTENPAGDAAAYIQTDGAINYTSTVSRADLGQLTGIDGNIQEQLNGIKNDTNGKWFLGSVIDYLDTESIAQTIVYPLPLYADLVVLKTAGEGLTFRYQRNLTTDTYVHGTVIHRTNPSGSSTRFDDTNQTVSFVSRNFNTNTQFVELVSGFRDYNSFEADLMVNREWPGVTPTIQSDSAYNIQIKVTRGFGGATTYHDRYAVFLKISKVDLDVSRTIIQGV